MISTLREGRGVSLKFDVQGQRGGQRREVIEDRGDG